MPRWNVNQQPTNIASANSFEVFAYHLDVPAGYKWHTRLYYMPGLFDKLIK